MTVTVSEALHVCLFRWLTQCVCSSCWEWKLWLWQMQQGDSMTATVWETSCSLRITSTCQALQGRARCVDAMMRGAAQTPKQNDESWRFTLLTFVFSKVFLYVSPGLENDFLACRMRMTVSWGNWPRKRQRSRAATASCRKGFTACWLGRHTRRLQKADSCRCQGLMLWVSTVQRYWCVTGKPLNRASATWNALHKLKMNMLFGWEWIMCSEQI